METIGPVPAASLIPCQARRTACNERVMALEEEIDALGDVDTLNQRLEEIKKKTSANKQKMSQLRVRDLALSIHKL